MVISKIMKFLNKKKKKAVKKAVRKPVSKKKTKTKKPAKIITKTVKSVKKLGMPKEILVAEAIHYFSHIKVAILRMKKPLALNDKIHIKGHTTDFTQNIQSMQMNHQPVDLVKKGQEIGILVKGKVRHKDKVYKVS
ncbi:MAG: hypothetical protein PHG69_02575 [Candidatus Omnitrophica bacterium]|nr:hypothetical protein [Candidatus Omnitrophota bacterium]